MRAHSIDSWPSQNSDTSCLKQSEHEMKDGSNAHADAYYGDISSISSSKQGGQIIDSEGVHDNDSDIFINQSSQNNLHQTIFNRYHNEEDQHSLQDELEISSQQSNETVTAYNNSNIEHSEFYINFPSDQSASVYSNTILSSFSDENALSESTHEISTDPLMPAFRDDRGENLNFTTLTGQQIIPGFYDDGKIDEETGKGSSIECTSENSPTEQDREYDTGSWVERSLSGNDGNTLDCFLSSNQRNHIDNNNSVFVNQLTDLPKERRKIDAWPNDNSSGSESSGIQFPNDNADYNFYDPLIGLRNRGRSQLELKRQTSLSTLTAPVKRRSFTESISSTGDIKRQKKIQTSNDYLRLIIERELWQRSRSLNVGTLRKAHKFIFNHRRYLI